MRASPFAAARVIGGRVAPHSIPMARNAAFMPGKTPFMLEPKSPVLYYLQRLRDEAHRFAIGAHRTKRKKAMTTSPLDEVPGIGPARKRALLMHFGTARAVKGA